MIPPSEVGGIRIAGGNESIPLSVDDIVDLEHEVQQAVVSRAIRCQLYRPNEPPQTVGVESLPDLIRRQENFVWIDFSDYREHDLQMMAQTLGLHRVAVHTALSTWQRPQLDVFSDHFFVTATVPRLDTDTYRIHAGELDLFVGNNYLLSAHKLPLPFVDRVDARARQSPQLVQYDSAFMLYIILDELLAYYDELCNSVQVEIEDMQQRALRDTSEGFLADLVRLKRYVFALGQIAEQHREVYRAFLRPDFPFVGGEQVDVYFRDVETRLARLVGTLQAAKEEINSAFDIYVSHVSHRTGLAIKALTIISAILLPISIIIVFFGTSFRSVPIYGPEGFIAMLVGIVVVTATSLLIFRSKGWL